MTQMNLFTKQRIDSQTQKTNLWLQKGKGGIVVQSLSHVQLFCNPVDCSPPSSSVHGISQAKLLEWLPFLSAVYVFLSKVSKGKRHDLLSIYYVSGTILDIFVLPFILIFPLISVQASIFISSLQIQKPRLSGQVNLPRVSPLGRSNTRFKHSSVFLKFKLLFLHQAFPHEHIPFSTSKALLKCCNLKGYTELVCCVMVARNQVKTQGLLKGRKAP